VTLDASPTVPVMLAAVKFVTPAPFPLVVNRLAGKFVSHAALPLIPRHCLRKDW
jgi:hypothetical protein